MITTLDVTLLKNATDSTLLLLSFPTCLLAPADHMHDVADDEALCFFKRSSNYC